VSELRRTLEIRTSPHLESGRRIDTIMFNVVVALAPTVLFGVWAFGLAAVAVLAASSLGALAAEALANRSRGLGSTLGDHSALVTGLLLGLTLPPALPLWMAAVGGAVAIGLGKALFGGLGFNPFNPALVGRAFLQAAFPVAMTSWSTPFAAGRFASLPSSTVAFPFAEPVYDALGGATPLAAWKFARQAADAGDLALGFVSGSTGETSALLILAGGAYLVARNFMSWRTPLAIFATVASLAGALHFADPARYASPAFMLTSGGLVLGAVFMATDMVTSPITPRGTWIYGVVIGALVVVIRTWAGMPEGVMYAVLLGNALAPHLDRFTQPRVYGTGGATATAKGSAT
jgi:electron transport complex protein RnfD